MIAATLPIPETPDFVGFEVSDGSTIYSRRDRMLVSDDEALRFNYLFKWAAESAWALIDLEPAGRA